MAYNAVTALFGALPTHPVVCCRPCLSFCDPQGRVGFAVHAETDYFLVNPHTSTGEDLQAAGVAT